MTEDLEEDKHYHKDEDEVGNDPRDLRTELRYIAVEESLDRAGHAVQPVAVGAVGKEAEGEEAPRRR